MSLTSDPQTDDLPDADTTPLPTRLSRGRWIALALVAAALALAGGLAFGARHRQTVPGPAVPVVTATVAADAIVATPPPGVPTPTPLAAQRASPTPRTTLRIPARIGRWS